jgi:hypothetical protein
MKSLPFAFVIFLGGLFSANALAQTPAPPPRPIQPPAGGYVLGVQAPKRDQDRKFFENLRMSYSMSYDGPRFRNFDLTQTQGPNDATSGFAGIDHALKIGYALSKKVVIGFQFTGAGSFDPNQGFSIGDVRNYFNWSKMVETDDIELQGVLRLTYPTTLASQLRGNILSVRVQGNWTFKTSLRNWSFTASTMLNTNYNKYPVGKDDFSAILAPYITYDLGPSVTWVFEGFFDSAHSYDAASLDYKNASDDSFDTGPMFTINSHTSLTSTIKFYTQKITFDTATPYLELNFVL